MGFRWEVLEDVPQTRISKNWTTFRGVETKAVIDESKLSIEDSIPTIISVSGTNPGRQTVHPCLNDPFSRLSRYHEPQLHESLAVQCALLHDTIEDTAVTFEEIVDRFGREVAEGVLSLTKDKTLPKSEQIATGFAASVKYACPDPSPFTATASLPGVSSK